MPTDYNFTGQRLDRETGLLSYGARYYDPLSGRFTQADLLQNNVVGMDPYAYVGENPETLIDPNGQMVGEPGAFGAGGDAAEAAALESGSGESFTDASSSTPIPYFSPEPSAVEAGNTSISYDANTGQITTRVDNADGSTTWSEVEPGTQAYSNDLQTFEYLSEGSPDESTNAFAQGQTVEGGSTEIGEASDTGLASTQTTGPETTSTSTEPQGDASPNTTKVYRVQGGTTSAGLPGSQFRLAVTSNSNIEINGNGMLHLNFGDQSRASWWLNNRGPTSQLVSFDVTNDFLANLRELAVPQSEARNFPGFPQIDDPAIQDMNGNSTQFGIPSTMFEWLLESIIPGSALITSYYDPIP